MKKLTVIKVDGSKQPFSEAKYRRALRRLGLDKDEVDQMVEKIRPMLYDGISTKKIFSKTRLMLRKSRRKGALARYDLKKAIRELGPSGYPFEKYFGAILAELDYKVRVGTHLQGRCIRHEIDILAIKGDERNLIECKFHAKQSQHTPVQVSLYMKARYDDVALACKLDKDCTPKYSDCWVVTNTRFSPNARVYGKCVGMTMISWSYPKARNLASIIDKAGLHPVTCLTSLSKKIKKEILKEGIVLARDLPTHKKALRRFNLTDEQMNELMVECKGLCQDE